MNAGDAMYLQFDAIEPPLSGVTRDYIFFCDGWVKDGDWNTVASRTVGPLPFHTMSGLSFGEMTSELKPLIVSESGKSVVVKPKIVVEIAYEEIQKSPTYSSGYALRFPRVKRLRSMERSASDITTLAEIEKLYGKQKKS